MTITVWRGVGATDTEKHSGIGRVDHSAVERLDGLADEIRSLALGEWMLLSVPDRARPTWPGRGISSVFVTLPGILNVSPRP